MILTELQLKNYKLHADRKIKFVGNLIGIVGPNGSGKSNLLGGIHFCLGGEHPGFKKEDLLRWGAEDGHVKLTLTNHGSDCMINRSVGTNAAFISYAGEEFRGITKVNGAITTHLGLDRELLRQTVFARQAEIDAVLFTDPRDRELAFQRLCGIGDATKIHKKLGEVLAIISAVPNYAEEIASAKARYKEITDRLKQLETSVVNSQSIRDQIADTSELQGQLQAYAAVLPVIQRLGVNLAENAEYAAQVNDAQTQLALLPAGPVDLTAIEVTIKQLRELITAAQEYTRLQDAWKQAGLALMEHGEAPKPTDPPHDADTLQKLAEDLRVVQRDANALQANLGLYRGLQEAVNALEDSAECPVCGGTIENTDRVDKQVDGLEGQVAQANSQAVGLHKTYTEAELKTTAHTRAYDQASMTWHTQYAALLKQYNETDAALQKVALVEHAVETLTEQLNAQEAKYQAAIADTTEVAQLNAQVQSGKAHIERLNTELADLGARTNDLSDVAEALLNGGHAGAAEYVTEQQTKQEQVVAHAQELDKQLAQLAGMITELRGSGEKIDKTISELEFKQAQQSELKAAVTVFNEVRDWFHYNNGPKTLSTSLLQDMTASVNDFLGQLSASFTVLNNDSALGFNCIFHDGRPMPTEGVMDAHHLSGGQRMQLAIAFRLASYCMFAGRVGLLSLDEPTTYLDDANVGYFCSLLPKLKEVAKSMDLQILIATHAKEVLPHMDTIVNLYPEGG